MYARALLGTIVVAATGTTHATPPTQSPPGSSSEAQVDSFDFLLAVLNDAFENEALSDPLSVVLTELFIEYLIQPETGETAGEIEVRLSVQDPFDLLIAVLNDAHDRGTLNEAVNELLSDLLIQEIIAPTTGETPLEIELRLTDRLQTAPVVEPDTSLSLSANAEISGYWSSGEAGVEITAVLTDTEAPWTEGPHAIRIVCRHNDQIVMGCGGEVSVMLPGDSEPATESVVLRTPMGDVYFEFDFGGIEPVTTQFHVPERILGVEKDVWECYSDEPDTADTPLDDQGYYGDCAGWGNYVGYKWDQDVPVKVWATGLESYIAILRESLEELSPLLDLEFVWADSEEEAALKAYMGLPASQATSFGFTQRCAESYGCVGLGMITNEGVVKGGRMSVWLNQDTWWRELGLLDERIKRTTVHEALHALVPMHHREDPGSIMNNRALLLPTPNRMDEALIRLHQHRLVKPGMTPGDIEPLIVFREDLLDSPSAPEQDGYELARSAFEALQEADSARFRIRGGWSGSNCDRSFGWADLEIIDFSPSHPRITRFKDSSVHFFMIHPAGRGGKLELWSEENGQWMEVGPSGIHDNSHWNRGFSRVHRLLASVLFFSDADEIRVLRDTEGLITLNVALDDAYIVLPWSGGETLEVVLTLKEDTLEILEYDFGWRFAVPSGNPCTSYTTMAVDGEYGIEIQIPDAILEGSANIGASRDAFHTDPYDAIEAPTPPLR